LRPTCNGKSEENTEMINDHKESHSYYLTIHHEWPIIWLLLSERVIWLNVSPLHIHAFVRNFMTFVVVPTWYYLTRVDTSFHMCSCHYIQMKWKNALTSFMWPYLAVHGMQQTQNASTGLVWAFFWCKSLWALLWSRKSRHSFHTLSSCQSRVCFYHTQQ
jgi:hypothetical protein